MGNFCRFCGKPLVNGVCDCAKFKAAMGAKPASGISSIVSEEKINEAKNQAKAVADVAIVAGKSAADKAYEAGKTAAEKAYSAGKDAAELAKVKAEEEKARQQAINDAINAKMEAAKKVIANPNAVSDTQMWSWLKKTSTRKHFYTEEPNYMSEEEFAVRVQNKIDENHVPAQISRKTIEWDRSGIQDTIFQIVPKTNAANPLSCFLRFNHVGNFTFVEEKTFIGAPDLPVSPERPIRIDASLQPRVRMLWMGIGMAIVSFFLMFYHNSWSDTYPLMVPGLVLLLIGAMLAVFGFSAWEELDKAKKHNEMVRLQQIAWNKAWNFWEKNIFMHAFQEDTNGELSRIYEAVFECVNQVSDEIFKDVKTEVQKEDTRLGDLEAMIQRRKDEYR